MRSRSQSHPLGSLQLHSPRLNKPWHANPLYAGMSESSARASWEAAQRREHEVFPVTASDGYDVLPAWEQNKGGGINLVRAASWPNEEPRPIDWVVRNRIPRGDVSTLDGDGGLGKTLAALQLAAAVALSHSEWLGQEVCGTGPVIFLSRMLKKPIGGSDFY